MRINPVLRNESKLAVRSIRFTLMVLVYVALLSVAACIFYYSLTEDIFANGLDMQYAIVFYIVMAVGQAVLLISIVPSLTATAICSEREKQTLDILLSSRLTPLQIIIGKVGASSLRVIMLIVCTMPLYAVCSLIGGVKLSNIIELILFFIVNTIFVGAMGVFVSTYIKTSKAATALTYGLVMFMYIGIIIVAFIVYTLQLRVAVMANSFNTVMPNINPIIYLSPVLGFGSLLANQVGLGTDFGYMFSEFGVSNYSHYISIIIQLVLSAIFIYLAAHKLNPLNKKIKNKK